jgi:broad specificity polyphosphatase/5'/3'-nucleotidase SurE
VIYSGTMSAAVEGIEGIPAIGFSFGLRTPILKP